MIPEKVNTLTVNDPSFPEALQRSAPPVSQLFWSGADPSTWLKRPKVAVVGSRRASPYGRAVTQRLVTELIRHEVVIISGLALGIDSIAHRSALDAGGCTVAILPTALDNVYPPSHLSLARRIVDHGGSLLTEYASGSSVYKENFVARNRIVSGLADVLLITEAAVASGTMHTARFALEQGKTVMTVPGNINQPGSEGCNNLIKSGAIPVTDSSDVLFALGISPKRISTPKLTGLNSSQTAVLRLITEGIADQETIASNAQLDGAELSSTLTSLELAGAVRPQGAGRWTLA